MSDKQAEIGNTEEVGLGKHLRALRTSRGLSVRSAAGGAGITPGGLSQIERGEKTPSLGALRKILGALGTGMAEFFSSLERCGEGSGIVFRSHQLTTVASSEGVSLLGLPGAPEKRVIQLLHETYAPRH